MIITDSAEMLARLGAATLIGAAIGLNRDRHRKPIGVPTRGLRGLDSAISTLVAPSGSEAVNSADAGGDVSGVDMRRHA